ncbi:hypothetical protein R1flu_021496 [Riccia fluitans]|uniref:Uncharacterized protein n=1 Tax=Riccia fluitans TaxID=41844 RepID=A0ABD1ZPI7_9MARC
MKGRQLVVERKEKRKEKSAINTGAKDAARKICYCSGDAVITVTSTQCEARWSSPYSLYQRLELDGYLDIYRRYRSLSWGIGLPSENHMNSVDKNSKTFCGSALKTEHPFHGFVKHAVSSNRSTRSESEGTIMNYRRAFTYGGFWNPAPEDPKLTRTSSEPARLQPMNPKIKEQQGNTRGRYRQKAKDEYISVYELLPEANPDVELVFFHGLQMEGSTPEDSFWRTWKMRGSEECWPEKLLPELLTGTRFNKQYQLKAKVLSISYEGRPKLKVDEEDMDRGEDVLIVEALMKDLILNEDVKVGQTKGVPVILVGHDLGGILIKRLVMMLEIEVGFTFSYPDLLFYPHGFRNVLVVPEGSSRCDVD